MTTAGQVAAVDLGATSGRVMLAEVGPDKLEMKAVARFSNDPVTLWNGAREALHWDLPGLFTEVCDGLADAACQADRLIAIGVDSWAVDYGLLRNGSLLGLPHHYRDDRTSDGVEFVHARLDEDELYRRNGLQFLPFNTVYQLAVDRYCGMLDAADTALLIPDLINYWLTGQRASERTNASTTGLLGIDGGWDIDLMRRLELSPSLFPEVVEAGSVRGPVLPTVRSRLGLADGVEVVSVASHDTASAVAAIPMQADGAAYISCGTWALVGVECGQPVVNTAARTANFTNEVGADGRIRFLHNVMGLWLLSETVRQYEREGHRVDLADLLAQAAHAPPPTAVFDTDDPRFLPPGDMPARINDWYTERGLPTPQDRPAMVRAIMESLAQAFADTVTTAAELSGRPVTAVHIVGGGSQNQLLCQLTADRIGAPLLAGPVEATALGNVLLTARAQSLISGGLDDLRALVAGNYSPRRYLPEKQGSAAQAQPVEVEMTRGGSQV